MAEVKQNLMDILNDAYSSRNQGLHYSSAEYKQAAFLRSIAESLLVIAGSKAREALREGNDERCEK